ncbi:MAG: hypothetical protein M3P48_01530, partial [Actinomycetota bacterium]|nr:hypothetical protein [Actinomycetota bacterium]
VRSQPCAISSVLPVTVLRPEQAPGLRLRDEPARGVRREPEVAVVAADQPLPRDRTRRGRQPERVPAGPAPTRS